MIHIICVEPRMVDDLLRPHEPDEDEEDRVGIHSLVAP